MHIQANLKGASMLATGVIGITPLAETFFAPIFGYLVSMYFSTEPI